MSVRILVGDAREVLAGLPAESVHCVITSPPYWGLRDYQLPPTVWGGEDPGCAHAWGEEERGRRKDLLPPSESSSSSRMGTDDRQGFGPPTGGHFCSRCGAWRGALGLEPDPALYVAHLVEVFRAVRRVLRDDGTCWVNLGDSYATRWGSQRAEGRRGMEDNERSRGGPVVAGLKEKDLIGIPWRVAFALQADGWWLRSEIIWAKPNPMPESVTDRPTKAHEQLFLLAKAERYYFDAEAVKEPANYPDGMNGHSPVRSPYGQGFAAGRSDGSTTTGRNKRSVWTIPSAPFPLAHFATFPPALVEPCVKAGTSAHGACPACGAPWRREIERAPHPADEELIAARAGRGRTRTTDNLTSGPAHWAYKAAHPDRVLGWAPSCACAPTPVPCVVLDPFAGAGTVGLVADRLGRDAILIELKPEYANLAEKRIREEAPLLTAVEVEAAAPAASDNGHGRAAPEQLGLWEMDALATLGGPVSDRAGGADGWNYALRAGDDHPLERGGGSGLHLQREPRNVAKMRPAWPAAQEGLPVARRGGIGPVVRGAEGDVSLASRTPADD
jgi:DNA modification methylase